MWKCLVGVACCRGVLVSRRLSYQRFGVVELSYGSRELVVFLTDAAFWTVTGLPVDSCNDEAQENAEEAEVHTWDAVNMEISEVNPHQGFPRTTWSQWAAIFREKFTLLLDDRVIVFKSDPDLTWHLISRRTEIRRSGTWIRSAHIIWRAAKFTSTSNGGIP